MNRKVIVKNELTDLKGKSWPEGLALLVKQKVKRNQMFSKMIELVKTGKSIVLIKKQMLNMLRKLLK